MDVTSPSLWGYMSSIRGASFPSPLRSPIGAYHRHLPTFPDLLGAIRDLPVALDLNKLAERRLGHLGITKAAAYLWPASSGFEAELGLAATYVNGGVRLGSFRLQSGPPVRVQDELIQEDLLSKCATGLMYLSGATERMPLLSPERNCPQAVVLTFELLGKVLEGRPRCLSGESLMSRVGQVAKEAAFNRCSASTISSALVLTAENPSIPGEKALQLMQKIAEHCSLEPHMPRERGRPPAFVVDDLGPSFFGCDRSQLELAARRSATDRAVSMAPRGAPYPNLEIRYRGAMEPAQVATAAVPQPRATQIAKRL